MPWDGTRPDTGRVLPTALCSRQIMLMAYTRTIPTRHARRIGHIRENGVVIKYSANQKYTTDAISAAVFEEICNRANVPYQIYVNRSDILGGSTLGNISTTQVPVNTVDIGLAQLAMHSPYETGSVKDTDYMIQAMKTIF